MTRAALSGRSLVVITGRRRSRKRWPDGGAAFSADAALSAANGLDRDTVTDLIHY